MIASAVLLLISGASMFLSGVCAGIAISQFEKIDGKKLP